MRRAKNWASSEASVNPGGGQNPSGICEGFGMPELERPQAEGLRGTQHDACLVEVLTGTSKLR
jgi:hypothetical protein